MINIIHNIINITYIQHVLYINKTLGCLKNIY